MFRSEEMGLYRFFTPLESAYEYINALGQINCLHIIDADENKTPQFNRQFNHI